MNPEELKHRFLERIDFETPIREKWYKNAQSLLTRKELLSSSTREKVINWANRWNLEPDTVFEKIQSEWLFALTFVKDPTRQSIHEEIASRFIQKILKNTIVDFKKLPNRGPQSLLVANGGRSNQETMLENGTARRAKSIDFQWKVQGMIKGQIKNLEFLASHKYTRVAGGAQDNQYKDLKGFAEEAKPCTNRDIFYLAIADGPYYLEEDENEGKLRLEVLKEDGFSMNKNKRFEACTSNQILWMVSTVTNHWKNLNDITLKSEEMSVLCNSIEKLTEPAP